MKQVVVVLGAQKARTSSIAAALGESPHVYFHPNEVALFEDPWPTDDGAVRHFVSSLLDRPEPVVGFKRADLLGRPEAPGRLARALGHSPLLLASLRAPEERALSALYWYVRQGLLPPLPANELLERLLHAGWLPGFPRSGEILSYGHYSRSLDRYGEEFGRGQLHLIVDGTWDAASARELGTRLGVDLHARKVIHQKPGVYSILRSRFARPWVPDRGRPEWDARFSGASPLGSIERRLRDVIDRYVLARAVPDDRIDASLLAGLLDHYREERRRLVEDWHVTLPDPRLPSSRVHPATSSSVPMGEGRV